MSTFAPPLGARRRLLLKGLLALPFGLRLAATHAAAAEEDCQLSFRHTHTDERLRVVYRSGGEYVDGAFAQIDHFLRDFRTGEVQPIDRRLLDIMYALCLSCGGAGTFEVISGFRSPATNTMLRGASGSGVAQHSLHMEGRAIDIRLAGFPTAGLQRAAVNLGLGGVGYYPSSDFVHVDTGRVRTWGPTPA